MYNTFTNTSTYTVIDIRKTFEGFDADFRMIARRTEKMSISEVDNYIHDILTWAESKYLDYIDIALIDQQNIPMRAVRYSIDENGNAVTGDRAGRNDWGNLPGTRLIIIVSQNQRWHNLSKEQQENFKYENDFKISWVPSKIDNSYSHLSRESAQLYASKGYELKKQNFK